MMQGKHPVVPISDAAGRIQGLVTPAELLRGIRQALARMEKEKLEARTDAND